MKNIIARYRGNYIAEMRKCVGHAPLMVIGCGVIIENEKGEILLQKRRDNGCWALLGGSMEIGEKFIATVKREAFEEAGIEIRELKLFGIYSGEDGIIIYPNGDQFFDKTNLPDNINKYDKRVINDWTKNLQQIIVD